MHTVKFVLISYKEVRQPSSCEAPNVPFSLLKRQQRKFEFASHLLSSEERGVSLVVEETRNLRVSDGDFIKKSFVQKQLMFAHAKVNAKGFKICLALQDESSSPSQTHTHE